MQQKQKFSIPLRNIFLEHFSKEQYDDIDVSLSEAATLTSTRTNHFYEWGQYQV